VLKAVSPLSGFSAEINKVSITEVSSRSLVSIAVPNGGLAALKAAIKKQLKLDLPEPGKTTNSKSGNAMLIWASPDQYLFSFDEKDNMPSETVGKLLNGKSYVTDQSDAWVTLKISGERKLEALERICPINLHPDVFKTGMAARTMMEHLGVLIIRDENDSVLLLSARSTAGSLLHAVETSAKNLH
jgi:heterotetrameric sarcosine oxidase gamma subunit